MRLAEHTIADPYSIDPYQPINWNHPLNHGLVAWLLTLPMTSGGLHWYDVLRRNHGTLVDLDPAQDWRPTQNVGNWGELDFGRTNATHVLFPSPFNPASTDFTIAVSVRFDGNEGASNNVILQQEGPNGRSWMYRNSGSNSLETFLGGTVLSGSTITPGNWSRIAIVKTVATVTLYQNGVSTASAARTAESETGDLRLGAHKSPSDSVRAWDGPMDGLRIHTRALSPSEVSADYELSRRFYPGLLNRISHLRIRPRLFNPAWALGANNLIGAGY